MIFQGKDILPIQVSHQVYESYDYSGIWKSLKEKPMKILNQPDIGHSKAWGYFDRDSQGSPDICGSGGILLLSSNIK